MTEATAPVLEVDDLHKVFRARGALGLRRRVIPAVDGISFTIERGQTVALLGESGCGKSTLARTILHLYKPDSGMIRLLGREVHELSEARFRPHRRHVQMVFQNPLTSFDPIRTIGYSIAEAMRLGPVADDRQAFIAQLLNEVGLSPRFADLRPGTVSGGELQRAALARALSTRPELVVMDEPTSALDMSIKGQILQLIRDLQERHDLSYLIVTHDLSTVRQIADEVIVMYLGQIVERGPTEEVFAAPRHPYTAGLLYAHDLAGRTPEKDEALRIKGTLSYPDPDYLGCRLVERCPLATERCRQSQELASVGVGHEARCWRSQHVTEVKS
jgi:oligopeptide/dipeptide ABC transporter ATP-binding protein